MKGLRFSVPLVRLVVPLDRIQSPRAASAKDVAQEVHSHNTPIGTQILLWIIRIETPLELLPPKTKPSPEPPTRSQQARMITKEKAIRKSSLP